MIGTMDGTIGHGGPLAIVSALALLEWIYVPAGLSMDPCLAERANVSRVGAASWQSQS